MLIFFFFFTYFLSLIRPKQKLCSQPSQLQKLQKSVYSDIVRKITREKPHSKCWKFPLTHCSRLNVVLFLVVQSYPTLCNPKDYSLPGSSVHGDSPGKNTRVHCHALLQGIFPTQGSNPGIPHCRQILYHLSHEGSPGKVEWWPSERYAMSQNLWIWVHLEKATLQIIQVKESQMKSTEMIQAAGFLGRDGSEDTKDKATWRGRQSLQLCGHSQAMPGVTKRWRSEKRLSPRDFRTNTALPTPWFQTSGLQTHERLNFCFFKPPSLWQCIIATLENW